MPRSTVGIACGAVACTTTAQLCCTADSGKTGACQMVANPSCGSTSFLCDGPEDCPPAEPECCAEAGLANCRVAGYCATKAASGARLMCHVKDATCAAPSQCADAPNGSPYALCI